MLIKKTSWVFFLLLLTGLQPAFGIQSDHPVIFAHGMAGFDDILGYDYWGNDYGKFVGDPKSNRWLDSGQKCYATAVTPFEDSEARGLELAEAIETYMAAENVEYINIVAHSQGGLDARKAAKILASKKGHPVVKVLCSISSPHRGSPLAKYMLDLGPGVQSVMSALCRYYGDIVYGPGNDLDASLKQLVYNDYAPDDGLTTGARSFNQNNPISADYAVCYASVITAQRGLALNPALYLTRELFYDIDGNGYCTDDCDNDGAAGCGNGNADDLDDDGLVGINSQQMGHRLTYYKAFAALDEIAEDATTGYAGAINAPDRRQMTSGSSVLVQDHVDVIGVGPDQFDEMEFYAALIEYIDRREDQ